MSVIDKMQNLVNNLDAEKLEETSLTELERKVLDEMAEMDCNGDYILEDKEQYLTVLDITVPMKQLRGILGSLVKKGYIEIYEDEDVPTDKVVRITNKFIEYHNNKTQENAEKIKLEPGMVIHCTTQDEVFSFLSYCSDKEMMWLSGHKPMEFIPYTIEEGQTCIEIWSDNKIGFGSLKVYENYKDEYYKILEFKDLGIELVEKITYILKFYDDEVSDEELADEERDFFDEQIDLMIEKYGDENVDCIDLGRWYQITIPISAVEKFEKRIELLENTFKELEFRWDIEDETA